MKFTIRDLLLVTVIVALAVGWWVDRKRLLSAKWEEGEILRTEINRAFTENAELRGEIGLPKLSAPAPNPPKP